MVQANEKRKKQEMADNAEKVKKEYGDKFAQEVSHIDIPNVRTLAVDKMASLYAEANRRPGAFRSEDNEIRSKAIAYAADLDYRQLENEEGPYAPAPPPAARAPEPSGAQPIEPATPGRVQPGMPEKERPADPPLNREQDPGRRGEGTPDRMPEGDPQRAPPASSSRSEPEMRADGKASVPRGEETEHAQSDRNDGMPSEEEAFQFEQAYRLSSSADRQQDGAPEHDGIAEPADDVAPEPLGLDPEPAMPARPPARTYADLKMEHADALAASVAGERSQANMKRLDFYEDRSSQRSASVEQKEARSSGAEKEQSDPGRKKLDFFEDKNPSKDHGQDH